MYYVTFEEGFHKVINEEGKTINKYKGINARTIAQKRRKELNDKKRLEA